MAFVAVVKSIVKKNNMKAEILKQLDEQFPVQTIGHHHYRRERYLKDFISTSIDKLLDSIEGDIENKKLTEYGKDSICEFITIYDIKQILNKYRI